MLFIKNSAQFGHIFKAYFPQLYPFSANLVFIIWLISSWKISPCFRGKMYLVISGLHKMEDLVLLQSSTCGGQCISWRRHSAHLCHTGGSSWQGKEKSAGGTCFWTISSILSCWQKQPSVEDTILDKNLCCQCANYFSYLYLLLSAVFLSPFEGVSSLLPPF